MKKSILTMVALISPLVVIGAQVTVNAPSVGGWAIMFDTTSGLPIDQQQFNSSGVAELNGLSGGQGYAVDITHDAAKAWQSRIYWDSAGSYNPSQGWDGVDKNVTALTGQITSRNYDVSTPGARKLSVTYSGATGTGVTLQGLNNESNALDAYLKVVRPGADVQAELWNPAMKKAWDPTTLAAGYSLNIEAATADASYSILTISQDVGDFIAKYTGKLNGSVYDLGFAVSDDPGDTAYWSTTDPGFGDGVFNELDGTVTFTSTSSNTDALDDFTPYYVYMDRAEIFDDVSSPASLTYARDGGLSLLDYNYYAIPEPAVLILILTGGGALLGIRRFFMV